MLLVVAVVTVAPGTAVLRLLLFVLLSLWLLPVVVLGLLRRVLPGGAYGSRHCSCEGSRSWNPPRRCCCQERSSWVRGQAPGSGRCCW